MKRSLAIFLLLVLLLQAGGLVFGLKIQQRIVKFRMAQIIQSESGEPEILALSLKEFLECRINDREILYKGSMYDIKSLQVSGDSVVLSAINDTKEKEIVDRINVTTGQTNHRNRELPGKVIRLFTLPYLLPQSESGNFVHDLSHRLFHFVEDNYCPIKKDILSPPPELA